MFVSNLQKSAGFYTGLLAEKLFVQQPDVMVGFQVVEVRFVLHSDANATWLPAGVPKGVGLGLHFHSD